MHGVMLEVPVPQILELYGKLPKPFIPRRNNAHYYFLEKAFILLHKTETNYQA